MTENSKMILLILICVELPLFIYLIITYIIDYVKHKQKRSIKAIIYYLIAMILSLMVLSVTFHVPAFLY